MREIVRIADTDLDGRKPIRYALLGIKGVGHSLAHMITVVFHEKTKTPWGMKLGEITEEQEEVLEEIIKNLPRYVPHWALNTQKDWETGKDLHLVGKDLDTKEMLVLKRLANIKSYRGLRRMWGLKVRGQRTRTHGRKNKQRMTRKKRK